MRLIDSINTIKQIIVQQLQTVDEMPYKQLLQCAELKTWSLYGIHMALAELEKQNTICVRIEHQEDVYFITKK